MYSYFLNLNVCFHACFSTNTKDEEKVYLKWQPGLEKRSTAEERNRRIQAFILTEHNVCVCHEVRMWGWSVMPQGTQESADAVGAWPTNCVTAACWSKLGSFFTRGLIDLLNSIRIWTQSKWREAPALDVQTTHLDTMTLEHLVNPSSP